VDSWYESPVYDSNVKWLNIFKKKKEIRNKYTLSTLDMAGDKSPVKYE